MSPASQSLKDEILKQVSLRQVAEAAGAVFRRRASKCPLHHGDNPNAFHLYDEGRRWHCFTGCPDGRNDGDLFSFYMRWKHVDYTTALHQLTGWKGMPVRAARRDTGAACTGEAGFPDRGMDKLGWVAPTPAGPGQAWLDRAERFVVYASDSLLHSRVGAAARAYLLSERGLHPAAWDLFRLGYNPSDLLDSPDKWGLDAKRIFLPRGIVIPGLKKDVPWYIKIRRPVAGDLLSEYLPAVGCRQSSKFISVRGGRAVLFGADLWLKYPLLLLVEGEWDAMLAYQDASGLCDVASLGSAARRAALPDLSMLSGYPRVLAVYDDDSAGDKARKWVGSIARVHCVPPPAHDLTDYFRAHNHKLLRDWIKSTIAAHLPSLIHPLDPSIHAQTIREWQSILDETRASPTMIGAS